MTNFGRNLAYLRKQMGLSQQELANRLQLAQSTIGNWESGKREPNLYTLGRLADFYDVSLDTLVGRSGELPVLTSPAPKLPEPDHPEDTAALIAQLQRQFLLRARALLEDDPVPTLETAETVRTLVATALSLGDLSPDDPSQISVS